MIDTRRTKQFLMISKSSQWLKTKQAPQSTNILLARKGEVSKLKVKEVMPRSTLFDGRRNDGFFFSEKSIFLP
jgi:hypothetical protein